MADLFLLPSNPSLTRGEGQGPGEVSELGRIRTGYSGLWVGSEAGAARTTGALDRGR